MADHNPKTDELNKRLDRMVSRAKSRRKDFTQLWQDGLNYIWDNQLAGKTRRKGWERISINYIWPATIQEVALLSQQKAKIIALPGAGDEQDHASAQVWQGGLQWQWDKELKMTLKRIAATLDAKVFGYSVQKVWWEAKDKWDGRALDWVGKTRSEVLHPMFCGADPEAESPDDWEYCFTERDVRLGWAKQRWPEKSKKLEEAASQQSEITPEGSDDDDSLLHDDVDTGEKGEGRISSLIMSAKKLRYTGEVEGVDRNEHPDDRVIKLQEVYFRDYETRHHNVMEKIPQEELYAQGIMKADENNALYNPESGEQWNDQNWPTRTKREYDEPLYPTGRMVLRVHHTILNDELADQRWNYKRWPLVITPNYILPHIWQGMGAVPMCKGLQDWMNVASSHLTNYLKFFGDPHLAVEEGALAIDQGLKKPRLHGYAGAIWKFTRNSINRFKVIDPPPLPKGVLEFFNLMGQEIRNQTGMQETIQGIGGKNMTATEATRLNANSRLRVSLQSAIQHESLLGIAQRLAECNQKNWPVDKWVRIVGDNKQAEAAQITQKVKDVDFDIDLEIGTVMPFDKERRKEDHEKAAGYVGNPASFPMLPELLEVLEIPNASEIFSRSQDYQQFEWVRNNMPIVMEWVNQAMAQQQQAEQAQEQEKQASK